MPGAEPLPDGEHAVELLGALGNAQRLRIIAALANGGRQYVSQLARDLEISRPLLQVHLKKLANAGLVSSHLEVSDEGKAMHFYELGAFDFELTPASIARAARYLRPDSSIPQPKRKARNP